MILTIADYRRLEAQAEDLADLQAFDNAIAAAGESFPDWIARRLIDGDHPVRVFRAYRQLTLADLARRTALRTSYLSKIESGKGAR